jgi:hypothetical protein
MQVFKATFRGKTVAVKKMSPELVKNEQAMGEFINELTLMRYSPFAERMFLLAF